MIRRAAPRRGFTMVELLVVIGVIAILASLITVAALRVQKAAKRTQASAEIAQIANAIAVFKVKMNADYIPCWGSGPNGTFQLKSSYKGDELEAIYFKRLFPQMKGCTGTPGDTTGLPDMNLDANQTLLFFLTGGSNVTSPAAPYPGFSANKQQPFSSLAVGSTENRAGPFIDFPVSRYVPGLSVDGDARAASLVDPWGSPYAYFSFNPMTNTYNKYNPVTKVYDSPPIFKFNSTTVQPYIQSNKFMNAKTFQIISAGENGLDDTAPYGFGGGGNWTFGSGDYADGGAGFDDLSNFHEGQLGVK